jgi:RNA polymerase sigma factor (sigma-70 family)
MIDAAARGDAEQRARFVLRYGPVVRATLESMRARRRSTETVEDLAQEVFLECLRQGGALARVEQGRSGGFRGFLYGVVRNVAAREGKRRAADARRFSKEEPDFDAFASGDEEAKDVFERSWARAVMREAAELLLRDAAKKGAAAERRVELLHLRFYEGLPIREIAKRWKVDPAKLHRDYADARKEFREALRATVAAETGLFGAEAEAECARLSNLLG